MPIRLPILSVESVLICLILAQERLGKLPVFNSRVKGNPAFYGWLVIAIATTVPEFSHRDTYISFRRKPEVTHNDGPPAVNTILMSSVSILSGQDPLNAD